MTTKTKGGPGSPTVEAEIKRLAEAELDFWRQIEVKKAELESANIGGQVLDSFLNGSENHAVSTVTSLRATIEGLERATVAARERRRDSILALFQARAQARRA